MVTKNQTLSADHRRKAGHYEILGETYAKFEFFEQGWNPYSRFLDVDKIDLILRKVVSQRKVYREVQVKYGKLFKQDSGWQSAHFDLSSWRFFKEDEFTPYVNDESFFVAYVLAPEIGYRGDIFIFPVRDFVALIRCGVASGGKWKVYLSRMRGDEQRWVLRRTHRAFSVVNEETCLDVSKYRRNFSVLEPSAV
jgi:hypothetical protein